QESQESMLIGPNVSRHPKTRDSRIPAEPLQEHATPLIELERASSRDREKVNHRALKGAAWFIALASRAIKPSTPRFARAAGAAVSLALKGGACGSGVSIEIVAA